MMMMMKMAKRVTPGGSKAARPTGSLRDNKKKRVRGDVSLLLSNVWTCDLVVVSSHTSCSLLF